MPSLTWMRITDIAESHGVKPQFSKDVIIFPGFEMLLLFLKLFQKQWKPCGDNLILSLVRKYSKEVTKNLNEDQKKRS